MLVLVETAAGYGLFRVLKSGLEEMDATSVAKAFATPDKAQSAVSLEAFSRFKDTKAALAAATALVESKLDKGLRKFLKKNINDQQLTDKLAVADKTLGGLIQKKLEIDVVYNPGVQEVIRGIRSQLTELIADISEKDMRTMALGLSHTLNRFKLKFSPEKVDTMIVQAIGLLDDLDRELNNFAMRLKEWYGWHFPELAKIVTDNVTYAKTIKELGMRSHSKDIDLSDLLTEEISKEVAQAAEISMGTEITDEDLQNILELCDRVIELSEYRGSLAKYLEYRMSAIAPNLTHMVGELVGARLIAHAGSLINLAKHPSSTVQILGAEKALFRALKTKKATPKYGLIYHAALVGQSAPKFKGKISRVLAAKLSLAIRVDALGDQTEPTVGIENKKYVEKRLMELESDATKGMGKFAPPSGKKYTPMRAGGLKGYDTSADQVKVQQKSAPSRVKEEEPDEDMMMQQDEVPAPKKIKKRKAMSGGPAAAAAAGDMEDGGEGMKTEEGAEEGEVAEERPKKKKKKRAQQQQDEEEDE
ncbi:unnamed protein product [Vitrella brassicaformis CCMP3155]|uniref:Nop domain-containing protein n=1 Tax=Vitrella brassicaformis (strain CCMP3155) TaxID=1169540 RepID=A0A0G4GN96_VITBC|nr:unnamed protein product [Vitrella brassicaformis CCMP3155]|mmetsp:Transcript_36144/g.90186  ORF Transcript_36144/g.90186 Transcript_36144/m.90186 type:complete len:532 (-) Transcript_36144:1247-2842(-)|eukprot:CEM31654.1 unnamed protein product [Vitrella brassicaformis CCMP3155]